jgi:oligoribonuclease NrnB/cAMP/cGMP phosphodiesterase (DHH superfamily)
MSSESLVFAPLPTSGLESNTINTNDSIKNIILYHGNCPDGYTSAIIWGMRYSDFKLKGVYPGKHLLDTLTKIDKKYNIKLLDLAIDDDIYNELKKFASYLVIDHHVSTLKLKFIAENNTGVEPNDIIIPDKIKNESGEFDSVNIIFDIKECGASLTWKYCYPNLPIAPIVQYVKDRDIWTFTADNSKEVNLALYAENAMKYTRESKHAISRGISILKDSEMHGNTIELRGASSSIDRDNGTSVANSSSEFEFVPDFDNFIVKYMNKTDFTQMAADGAAMDKLQVRLLKSGLNGVSVIDFYGKCAIINMTVLQSDLGNYIVKNYNVDFVLLWRYDNKTDLVECSLRSDQFNVSEVARKYGGGGHIKASGFKLNMMNFYSIIGLPKKPLYEFAKVKEVELSIT